jgi:membrane protein YdbS with pleckstrin-like domain
MSRHHRLKAAIGIFLGLGIAIGAAVGAYYDWDPDEISKFGLLVVVALPFAIWGCAHLARARGYPSDIAYVLFFLTTIAGAALAYAKTTALLLGFSYVFVILFPVIIILLVLPKKPHSSRRHGYSGH